MRDTVVIGDVHGCGEELKEMFERLERWARDCQIVLIGDLLTKGPRPDLVIDQINEQRNRGRRIRIVCGNHELRALTALRRAGAHGDTASLPPKLASMVECLAENDMIEDAITLLKEAMSTMRIGGSNPKWNAVHAGIDPELGLAQTPPKTLLSIKAGPDEADWWWRYSGRDGLIVVGHKPLSRPLILRRPDGRPVVAAIDTGCVYGGYLTAYRIRADRVLMVRSQQRRQWEFKRRVSRRPADSAWRAVSAGPLRKLVH